MTILYKVFAPMATQWQEVLYWVIIASITLANLFALRQENLKRLMRSPVSRKPVTSCWVLSAERRWV